MSTATQLTEGVNERQRQRLLVRVERMNRAVAKIQALFEATDGSPSPWYEEITFTREQANELLDILMAEPMYQRHEYDVTVTVTYEITARVSCANEDEANRAAENLIGNLGGPDVREPYTPGVEWIDSPIADLYEHTWDARRA